MSISFTTTYDALSAPLDTIKALHTNRPPVPALGLIRLAVSDRNRVSIEAFDYETAIVADVSTDDVDGLPGQLMLNRAMLTHLVKSFAVGATKAQLAKLAITVQEDGGSVTLSAGGYRFAMPITKGEEDNFPSLPQRQIPDAVDVDRDLFVAAATRLLICAGTDQTLPMLTGIYMTSVPGGLEVAATDRYRLGVGFVATTTPDKPITALLPAKALTAIVRHMPVGELSFGFGDGPLVWIVGPGLSVSLRTMDAEFVKYKALIPRNVSGKVTHHDAIVPRKDLVTAMKRTAAVVDRGHHARLQIAGNTITVTAGGDEGRMESPAFPSTQDGEDLGVIAFNPAYIGPALSSFATDRVAIRYSTAARPIMFAEPGDLDNERAFRTLVMPARLPG